MTKYLRAAAFAVAVTLASGASAEDYIGRTYYLLDPRDVAEYTALLATNADGSGYSAAALVRIQHDIEAMGVSWDDAGKAIRHAIKTGLNQTRIKDWAQAARDMSGVHHKSFIYSFEDLTDNFSNGFLGIQKWDREHNTFTADQYKRFSELFYKQKGDKVIVEAFDIVSKKYRAAAAQMNESMGAGGGM
jgi:hypothetical protein